MTTDALNSSDIFKRALAAYEAGQFAEAERLCGEIHRIEAGHFDANPPARGRSISPWPPRGDACEL